MLVTGGAGFVGANLVRRLLAAGDAVTVFDNLSNGRPSYLEGTDATLIEGDLRDADAIAGAVSGADAVVHLAAAGSVPDSVSDPRANLDNNVIGTFNTLDATRRAGIERIVLASTGGAIIGNARPPVNESTLPKPISPYGASKLACEGYAHAFSHSYDMRAICVRFANVYGPYSGHKKGAITVFFKAIHDGTPLTIFANGEQTRDYLYVEDICSGIVLALGSDEPGGSVFHLASGVETNVSTLAAACIRAAGRDDHPLDIDPNPRSTAEVERNFATYDLAHERLGFTPQVDLADGLAETWNWYSEHVFSQ